MWWCRGGRATTSKIVLGEVPSVVTKTSTLSWGLAFPPRTLPGVGMGYREGCRGWRVSARAWHVFAAVGKGMHHGKLHILTGDHMGCVLSTGCQQRLGWPPGINDRKKKTRGTACWPKRGSLACVGTTAKHKRQRWQFPHLLKQARKPSSRHGPRRGARNTPQYLDGPDTPKLWRLSSCPLR